MFTDRIYQNILDKPNKKSRALELRDCFGNVSFKRPFFFPIKVSHSFLSNFIFWGDFDLFFIVPFQGLVWENRLWSFGDGASWTIWPSSVCFVLLVRGPSSCSPFQYWIDRPLLLGAIRACVFDRRVDTQILNRANVGWPKFSKSGRSSYYSFQRTANCSLFATCACTWPPSYNCSWAGIAPPQCNKVRSALLTHFEAPNLFTLFFCYMYMYSEMIQPLSLYRLPRSI